MVLNGLQKVPHRKQELEQCVGAQGTEIGALKAEMVEI